MTPLLSETDQHGRESATRRRLVRLVVTFCVAFLATAAISGCARTASIDSAGEQFEHAEMVSLPTPVQNQLRYVDQYWKSYNTARYGDMNAVGGDCANFVNQTLVARGWQMTAAWHNDGPGKNHTLSWSYVPSMDSYFAEDEDDLGLQEFDLSDRSKVAVGDIAMFSWEGGDLDHVMVVTGIEHTEDSGTDHVDVYLSGHNLDELDMSLDDILARYPDASGHFWHLEDT